MKNFLLATVLAVGTISVNASTAELNGPLDSHLFESEVSNEKTYFETLGDMFKKGQKPNPEKLVNVFWSGRCFFASHPNTPLSSGYIFRKDSKSDVGPIGARKLKYEAFGFYNFGEANYYDNKTLKEIFKSPSLMPFEKVIETSTSFISGEVELKYSDKYLILEVRTKPEEGPIASEKVHARCYYFIPGYSI